jgi:hypothetical protein
MGTREVRLFSDWSFLYILCILVNGYHIYVLGRYERLQGQRRNDVEPSAGKLVMMDVFQAPRFPEILCIVVGNGLQITCTALVMGSFFDVIFLTSSVPPGMSALTCMIFIYSFFSIVGGYVATWMWSTFKDDARGWISISLGVACLFPGFVFTLHILLNVMYWSNNSTCAMSIWVSILLLLICVGMSVPLTLLGGFLGRRVKRTQFPMPTNREIPSKDQFPWLWIFVAGVVTFGCIMYVATFSSMSSIWWGRVYYPSPGNLSLLLRLLVLVCSHGSRLLTFPNSSFRGSPPVVEDRFCLRPIGILRVSILPQLSLE